MARNTTNWRALRHLQATGEAIDRDLDQIAQLLVKVRQTLGDLKSSAPGRPVAAEEVRSICKTRRIRAEVFGTGMFGDPPWEILLELFAAYLDGTTPTVTDLCAATGTPATTALRWVERLEEARLVCRAEDARDRRRTLLSLSPLGLAAMNAYFNEASALAAAT